MKSMSVSLWLTTMTVLPRFGHVYVPRDLMLYYIFFFTSESHADSCLALRVILTLALLLFSEARHARRAYI